ncbi:MAG TPA: hydroxymethylbilane synthase [Chloroflexia bacterium]|nr:hydroxymethylbilane synthase [Chloroflexia bacterium]
MGITDTHTRILTIGTRSSKLALVQAEIVRAALLRLRPDLDIRLEHITTRGDVVQDRPLSEIGGNGLFVTQIEDALRACRVDVAVHSAKDLQSMMPPDMALAAFLPRADARDVLVSRDASTLSALTPGARVGTSSPRRTCQLRALRSDLTVLDIRGNVDTRLRKLRDGQYDAIVLAAAGLERLGMLDCVTEWFPTDVMIPAVAQGALAVEVRAGDSFALDLVSRINDPTTSTVVLAERAFLAHIGGGCSLPVGAYATASQDEIRIVGMIGSVDGHVIRGDQVGDRSEPEQVGMMLAGRLLAMGGRELIEADGAK